jgi:outer membrane lipoprotein-sorting protein
MAKRLRLNSSQVSTEVKGKLIMRRSPHSISATMSLLLFLSSIAYSQSTPPNPKAILKEMVSRYSGFSSYQDTGVVQTLPSESLLAVASASPSFITIASGDTTLVSFKTYFARPRLFRFDWKGAFIPSSRVAVVWSDGNKDYSWMPSRYPGRTGFELSSGSNLSFYTHEASGTSAGAIFFVPSLLMDDIDDVPFGRMVTSMTELALLGDERMDGEDCRVIKGKIDGTPWVLWIGKKSYLLRKTRTLYTSSSFHEMVEKGRVKTSVAEEVHHDIKVNEKIPTEVFKYQPHLLSNDVDLTR